MLICFGPGGALVVRHNGTELVYDWSKHSSLNGHAKIEWAAFYSDCEHEVMPMQSGHRITLAYNLYVSDRVGWALKQPNCHFNPSLSISYKILRDLLLEPAFMKRGKLSQCINSGTSLHLPPVNS